RRIVNFKRRTQELQSELDAVNADLEDSKRLKEVTEQELKGYDVELAMAEASIQTLEIIKASLEDISAIGSNLEAIKVDSQDDFIDRMLKLNSNVRNFQDTVKYAFDEANSNGTASKDEPGSKATNAEDAEVSRRALENELPQIMSQTTAVEQEYPADQNANKQIEQELLDVERKTSEFEETCASLGDELQKRCVCPSCHLNNVEALGGILQKTDRVIPKYIQNTNSIREDLTVKSEDTAVGMIGGSGATLALADFTTSTCVEKRAETGVLCFSPALPGSPPEYRLQLDEEYLYGARDWDKVTRDILKAGAFEGCDILTTQRNCRTISSPFIKFQEEIDWFAKRSLFCILEEQSRKPQMDPAACKSSPRAHLV
ncbi:hypothetical protein RJ639_022207, partial [Escallonia herrerae]